jgi:hypothetical protein
MSGSPAACAAAIRAGSALANSAQVYNPRSCNETTIAKTLASQGSLKRTRRGWNPATVRAGSHRAGASERTR